MDIVYDSNIHTCIMITLLYLIYKSCHPSFLLYFLSSFLHLLISCSPSSSFSSSPSPPPLSLFPHTAKRHASKTAATLHKSRHSGSKLSFLSSKLQLPKPHTLGLSSVRTVPALACGALVMRGEASRDALARPKKASKHASEECT